MKPTKFFRIDPITVAKNKEAIRSLADEEIAHDSFGKVSTPIGKRLCTIKDGKPTHFWDSDDGWQTVPSLDFIEV